MASLLIIVLTEFVNLLYNNNSMKRNKTIIMLLYLYTALYIDYKFLSEIYMPIIVRNYVKYFYIPGEETKIFKSKF